MRQLVLGLGAVALLGGFSAAAYADPHVTRIPVGQVPAQPGTSVIPCDIRLGYDDGSDDTQDSGPTLGWYSDTGHQYLGVRFTPPATGYDYRVQSASFFCDFWVEPGPVEFHAQQFDDPTNETSASVDVLGGGTWEVEFTTPICIPAGSEYVIMICPTLAGGWGVCGEDLSAPHGRSYYSDHSCAPINVSTSFDLMIQSCVTECGSVSTTPATWGSTKAAFK